MKSRKRPTVSVTGDAAYEPDETVNLVLSSPVGATVSDGTGVLTIRNDDPAVYLSVNDVVVTEGNSGTATATFTITRSGSTSGTASVKYATSPGTATAGTDYTAVPATTVSFLAGETTKSVAVTVNGDPMFEPDEDFRLVLSSPVGATVSDNTGVATIVNAAAAAAYLSVSDAVVTEGNTGTKAATFNITRSGSTAQAVTLKYATSGGTASAGIDCTAVPLTPLTFLPGETTKSVAVSVLGDTVVERNESFLLALSAAVGATVSDIAGSGTIVDDDGAVTPGPTTFLALSDATVTEGDSGTSVASFTIRRTGNVSVSSTVKYATSNSTALAGSDYVAVPMTAVTFAAGETAKTVNVSVIGDTAVEASEYFYLILYTPTGAVISDTSGVALVVNDDAAVYLSVGDVSVSEGGGSATFTVTRSGNTAGTASVKYATVNGTATAGSDYTAVPLTVVNFAAGETAKPVSVPVTGDSVLEGDETFSLTLSSPIGATISDTIAVATVVNDDPAVYLSAGDVSVIEGNSGTTPATFTITRSGSTAGALTVKYATSNGSATAGIDYTAVPLTAVTFAAGETAKTVTVSVTGETVVEPNQTFSLVLSVPVGATITDNLGVCTIVNDD